MSFLGVVGGSLREAFFMFWATLWALVLGFSLSGAVQAFVSRGEMQKVMGDHKAVAVARSSLLGMASSSCSYAASALARSLWRRGADFTTAMVFMFASTNLVVELGIVLWLLLGWQFALAEFVGGAIMIAALVLVLPLAAPARTVAAARARAAHDDPADAAPGASAAPDGHACHEHLGQPESAPAAGPLRRRLRERSRWADAAGYMLADLRMLRREIVIGFVVAGVLAVAVPTAFWSAVFLPGHGALTLVENAVVGPFVAIISFVCSVGNVPLAAALWHDGISFGGVVAFVFADLISLPLLLIYRKFYGGRLTLRLLGVFWLVMSAAGLLTELLFRAAGITAPARRAVIAPEHFGWDYTTILNIVFLAVFAALFWLHRQAAAAGPSAAVAVDPECGMQVEKANPGAVLRDGGEVVYFCSGRCRDRYQSRPAPDEPVRA